MRSRTIVRLSHRYRLLLAFLSAIIIQLPQYIDSIWSISERMSGEDGGMSLYWLYAITIPLGLGLLATVWWLSKKPVLNDTAKAEVTELLTVVNELEDRMEHFYDQILYHEGDRMKEFAEALNNDDFKGLWDRYSSLRARVGLISPKLSEQARKLVSLLRHFYGYILKDTLEHEKSALEATMSQSTDAIEVYRRAMSKTVEGLIR